jgi:hypothetical protein
MGAYQNGDEGTSPFLPLLQTDPTTAPGSYTTGVKSLDSNTNNKNEERDHRVKVKKESRQSLKAMKAIICGEDSVLP